MAVFFSPLEPDHPRGELPSTEPGLIVREAEKSGENVKKSGHKVSRLLSFETYSNKVEVVRPSVEDLEMKLPRCLEDT